jgi:hypothetical protein
MFQLGLAWGFRSAAIIATDIRAITRMVIRMRIRPITRTGLIQDTIGIIPEGTIGLDIGMHGPTIGITGGASIMAGPTVELTHLSCQEHLS